MYAEHSMAGDGNVYLGEPFIFNRKNIDNFKF